MRNLNPVAICMWGVFTTGGYLLLDSVRGAIFGLFIAMLISFMASVFG